MSKYNDSERIELLERRMVDLEIKAMHLSDELDIHRTAFSCLIRQVALLYEISIVTQKTIASLPVGPDDHRQKMKDEAARAETKWYQIANAMQKFASRFDPPPATPPAPPEG